MTISLVQHAISPEGTGPTGTTVALSFGVAVTSGNAVVGTLTYSQGTGGADNFTTLQDDKGNSYTPLVGHFFDSTNTQYCSMFHLENITNGPITLTASFSPGVGFRAMAMAEFSGVATSSAFDGATGQLSGNSTATDAVTSGNITTTANGDLVYSSYYDEAVAGATFTQGTNYTLLDKTTGSSFPFGHEYQIQSSSGAIAGTWTQSVSGGADALVVALKAAVTSTPTWGFEQNDSSFVRIPLPKAVGGSPT